MTNESRQKRAPDTDTGREEGSRGRELSSVTPMMGSTRLLPRGRTGSMRRPDGRGHGAVSSVSNAEEEEEGAPPCDALDEGTADVDVEEEGDRTCEGDCAAFAPVPAAVVPSNVRCEDVRNTARTDPVSMSYAQRSGESSAVTINNGLERDAAA